MSGLHNQCEWDVREKSSKKIRQDHYVPESFAHPAKMSIGLCRAILETYTQPGMIVLDPMAGIGSTLVEAALLGRHGVGVELEERFATMARLNVAHAVWQEEVVSDGVRNLGSGLVVRGNSRHLAGVLADSSVFSPPYPGTNHPMGAVDIRIQAKYPHDCDVSRDPANIANMALFSPPFGENNRGGSPKYLADKALPGWKANGHFSDGKTLQVSQDPANVDNLPMKAADMALLSPPYGDAIKPNPSGGWTGKLEEGNPNFNPVHTQGLQKMLTGYSANPENIGNMKLPLVVSLFSPPYGQQDGGNDPKLEAGRPPGTNKMGYFWHGVDGERDKVSQDPENVDNIKFGRQDEKIAAAILSPPYASRLGEGGGQVKRGEFGGAGLQSLTCDGYTGSDPNHYSAQHDLHNVGNLRIGTLPVGGYLPESGAILDAAAVFSPPFGDSKTSGGLASPELARAMGQANRNSIATDPANVDAAVLSPPYWNRAEQRTGTLPNGDSRDTFTYSEDSHKEQVGSTRNRGGYLDAMRDIYQGIYDVLPPGGIMVLVTKNFVRAGKMVPLNLYTVQLCERIGWTFRSCPEGCPMDKSPHTHKCGLHNVSFWIRLAAGKWNAKNPGQEAENPYQYHEDVLVFAR